MPTSNVCSASGGSSATNWISHGCILPKASLLTYCSAPSGGARTTAAVATDLPWTMTVKLGEGTGMRINSERASASGLYTTTPKPVFGGSAAVKLHLVSFTRRQWTSFTPAGSLALSRLAIALPAAFSANVKEVARRSV